MKKIHRLIQILNIDLYRNGNKLVGCCPVHKGDNQTAFNIDIDTSSNYYGRWYCNTHDCHRKYGNNLVGLIMGFYNYEIKEAIKFLDDFTQGVEVQIQENDDFINFFSKEKSTVQGISREEVRKRLIIPSQYYIERGFLPEILDEFDIGLSTKGLMKDRIVFPVYYNDVMVGCTGRTIIGDNYKWINSKGFNKSHYLYGLWKTDKYIQNKSSVILVEGQGDMLKLYSAGIKNVAGMFGKTLSDTQEFLLQKLGVLDIILLTDNDDPGKQARLNIENKVKDLFNVHHAYAVDKDCGDMTITDIQQILVPQIERYI